MSWGPGKRLRGDINELEGVVNRAVQVVSSTNKNSEETKAMARVIVKISMAGRWENSQSDRAVRHRQAAFVWHVCPEVLPYRTAREVAAALGITETTFSYYKCQVARWLAEGRAR